LNPRRQQLPGSRRTGGTAPYPLPPS
jgi:hypothetical protein